MGRNYNHVHRGKKQVWFVCACECGNIVTVSRSNLTTKAVSCGCVRREKARTNIQSIIKESTELTAFNKLLNEYKHSAKARNHLFDLTNEQFNTLINGNCYYCGILPNRIQRSYARSDKTIVYNGIDRKDNSVGYIIENCVSCCTVCNLAKRSMTEQEFYTWINRVYNHVKDKINE